jgi:NAD(P)-dependent dehydrogenase (short-subunit alcohol dehydrogenase family)
VFGELSDALGGIDRVIVNAGIGKGAKLGSGKLWANKATIETNLVAALVQIETALEMFNDQGSGHLVLISSVLGSKGVPGVKAAYAASKARAEFTGRIAARRIRRRPDHGGGDGTRLHRVGDDGPIAEHIVVGGQRNWRHIARRRH